MAMQLDTLMRQVESLRQQGERISQRLQEQECRLLEKAPPRDPRSTPDSLFDWPTLQPEREIPLCDEGVVDEPQAEHP